MYVIDSHCDSIERRRAQIIQNHNFSQKYPQLQFCAVFVEKDKSDGTTAYKQTIDFIEYFEKSIKNERDKICKVTDFNGISDTFHANKHAAILTLEGGCSLSGDVTRLDEFYKLGVRFFGMSWHHTELAKSNRIQDGEADTGLSELGKAVVKRANQLGIIIDVSHLSDKSFWDVLSLSKKPIAATHSNFRSVCNNSRNLTDEMALEIKKKGGIIGLNLYPPFIKEKNAATKDIFCHIDHALSLGLEDCLGFGFDIDGTDGLYPDGINESQSIHDQIIKQLLTRYPQAVVEKIAYKNYFKFLKDNLQS